MVKTETLSNEDRLERLELAMQSLPGLLQCLLTPKQRKIPALAEAITYIWSLFDESDEPEGS